MNIQNNPIQASNEAMKQILTSAQSQGTDLAEKMLKMNAMQVIDQSQTGYMGAVLDLYV